MATVDQFNAAQQSGQTANPTAAPNTAQSNAAFQNTQADWANQYLNTLKQGNQDPQELGRYLNYQAMLPSLKNANMTSSYGYKGTDIQGAQRQFMNNYSQQIAQGTNNLSQMGQYQGYLKAFGGKMAAPSDQVMKQLSVEALNGNRGAQQYLTAMHLTPQSGTNLWQNFDPKNLQSGSAAYNQYMTDNPYSATTKDHDNQIYNQYSGIIKNGQQLDNNQASIYQGLLNKWNLQDMRDPFVQGQATMKDDKQQALNAQDVATNQSLATADANNFQTMQTTMQDMNNRGLGDSGLAQAAYQQATMGANQQYQKAYADAATNKAGINNTYDTAINDLQQKGLANQQAQQQQQVANQQASVKEQNAQDQFLTAQTGMVWVGGKPVMSNGQPITTIAWDNMTETQRHDLATEANAAQSNANTAQQNQNTYNLGIMNNQTANAKIQADLSMKADQLKLDWANHDLNATDIQSKINAAINSANIAAQNASTSDYKAKAGAAAAALNNIKDLITPYIKAKQSVPANLQKQYDQALAQYNALSSGDYSGK